jgi:hypothetical protein
VWEWKYKKARKFAGGCLFSFGRGTKRREDLRKKIFLIDGNEYNKMPMKKKFFDLW